jgi:hypothetical protein
MRRAGFVGAVLLGSVLIVGGLLLVLTRETRRELGAPGDAQWHRVHILGDASTAPSALASQLYLPLVYQAGEAVPTPKATRTGGQVPLPAAILDVDVSSTLALQQQSADGYTLLIEGEVRNDNPVPVTAVRILAEALGAQGSCGRGALAPLGQQEAVLLPGEKWPFSGTLYASCPAQFVRCSATAIQAARAAVRLQPTGCAVGVSTRGNWQLTCRLTNNSPQAIRYPRAVVTLYGPEGSYVAAGLAYASIAQLVPGGSANVVVEIERARSFGWASYVVIGTGEL